MLSYSIVNTKFGIGELKSDMPLSGLEYRVGVCMALFDAFVARANEYVLPSYSAQGALNVQGAGNIQGIRVDFTDGSQGRVDLLNALDVCLAGISVFGHIRMATEGTHVDQIDAGERPICEKSVEFVDADFVKEGKN